MFDLEGFIIHGHRKVIDHYYWARNHAASDEERELFQRRAEAEQEALNRFIEHRSRGAQRAA